MIEVTAGIIQNASKKVLITRRKAGKHLAGFWEFPGGKIEADETPEVCLAREIMEELNIGISVRSHFMDSTYDYDTKSICLKGYLADYLEGDIILTDHDQYKWVAQSELSKYEFAPADIPIVKKLMHDLELPRDIKKLKSLAKELL
ncbi:8-oxo-dGTP diphosphatase MutT [Robiginitalea biformata]|uniref:8-oxo-dGTP diphosphatase n=1 Tax=Robiginitalea biformata (strain ATCC BAA-864 / DSM 15991 / KCTC 12146 / HTCC2501) TaxID=313596 RepID=A4CI90_ROBBH|nr:8-oxo-dGTP diphosphatase MutT [Robiginitalea biformata]EAR16648.1 Nudix (MutT) family hydrolase/pyrophosphatase [Robiginitalea biformata HTCC2501]